MAGNSVRWSVNRQVERVDLQAVRFLFSLKLLEHSLFSLGYCADSALRLEATRSCSSIGFLNLDWTGLTDGTHQKMVKIRDIRYMLIYIYRLQLLYLYSIPLRR